MTKAPAKPIPECVWHWRFRSWAGRDPALRACLDDRGKSFPDTQNRPGLFAIRLWFRKFCRATSAGRLQPGIEDRFTPTLAQGAALGLVHVRPRHPSQNRHETEARGQ